MRLIESICQRISGQRRLDDRGVAIVEFALVFPILLLMTFGAVEIGLILATQSTLEGGLKEASRYGITGQSPSDATRIEKIRAILDSHTLDLVKMSEATFTVKTYPSFSMVGQPEPFVDGEQYNEDGSTNPCFNGKFDDPLTTSCEGEKFLTDTNGNGHWDADIGTSGAGAGGEVVSYSVVVPWHIMTPAFGDLFGYKCGAKWCYGVFPLRATIVVRNEPNLYN
jgi:Flp pilus assembly protein TadG